MFFMVSFFIVYILLHYYIFHRIAVVFKLQQGLYLTVLAIFILLALWGISAQFISDKENHSVVESVIFYGYIWFGTLSILSFLFIITDISFIFIRNNNFIYYSTIAACILALLCSAYSVFNVYRGPVIKNISLQAPNLETDKLTIVELADIHIDTFVDYAEIQKLIETTNNLNPDIVAIVGDLIDMDISDTYHKYGLNKIKSKYGIFAVSGNHEYYTGINGFKSLCDGIDANVLNNSNVLVNNMFYIAGIPDTVMSKKFGIEAANIDTAFENIDFTKPVIFLSHQPNVFAEASKYPITLQLSAHTHAGQIPPFDLIESLFFKYFYGLYKENNSYLYITSGSRWWGPPMRLFSRSEIVKITLIKNLEQL